MPKPWRSPAKRKWIAKQPCCNCGGRDVQCAHLRNEGLGQKCSDEFTVPLCIRCHDQFDGRRRFPSGQFSNHAAFETYFILKLSEIACDFHEMWMKETKRTKKLEQCDWPGVVRLMKETRDGKD